MNRLTGLILVISVGTAMSACASAGGSAGGTGDPAAAAQGGTKPSDNGSTREASRAIGIAMLQEDGAEKRALYQQALESALASIASEPGNPRGWFLAGQAYANLGDYVGADTAFDRAQEIYPAYEQEIDPERENAWVSAYNAGITAYQQNDMATAIEQLEAADRVYQKRPEARLNLGAFYAQQDQMEKAIEAYRGALEILRGPVPETLDEAGRQDWEQNEAIAATNLGQLLATSGRHAEAEQVYREFIERHPGNLNAQISLAESLAQQGKSAEAGQAFADLLSRTDLDDAQFLMIGVGLFRAEQYERAADAFRKAAETNPYSRDAHYNLSQALYVYAGDLDEARKAATGEEAKAIEAKLATVHRELSSAAEEVLELDPFNRNILAYLARAYQSLSQLTSNAAERKEYQAKVQEVLKRHEAFAFELNDVSIQTDEGEVRVNGTVKNLKLQQGQPIRIRFTMLSRTGSPIGNQDLTVSAPAPEAAAPFRLTIPVSGTLAGWKYERID